MPAHRSMTRHRPEQGGCQGIWGSSLLPLHSTGWAASKEFAAAFRTVLLDLGFTHTDLANIGAHSLKVTCLSWLAKHGADREDQGQ